MHDLANATRNWLQWVALTSHPLNRFDDQGELCGIASATLIEHRGSRALITAAHIDVSSGWVLRTGVDSDRIRYFRPHSQNFARALNYRRSTGDFAESDLCICPVPEDLSSSAQERLPRHIGAAVDRHVFCLGDVEDAEASQTYAFAGEVMPERHAPHTYFTQPSVYPGLKLVREDRHVYEFRLPVDHPGHDQFKGCSGAPVVDLNKKVVGIVISGVEKGNVIKAVRIQPYLKLLDGTWW